MLKRNSLNPIRGDIFNPTINKQLDPKKLPLKTPKFWNKKRIFSTPPQIPNGVKLMRFLVINSMYNCLVLVFCFIFTILFTIQTDNDETRQQQISLHTNINYKPHIETFNAF